VADGNSNSVICRACRAAGELRHLEAGGSVLPARGPATPQRIRLQPPAARRGGAAIPWGNEDAHLREVVSRGVLLASVQNLPPHRRREFLPQPSVELVRAGLEIPSRELLERHDWITTVELPRLLGVAPQRGHEALVAPVPVPRVGTEGVGTIGVVVFPRAHQVGREERALRRFEQRPAVIRQPIRHHRHVHRGVRPRRSGGHGVGRPVREVAALAEGARATSGLQERSANSN
jgi:hypothetical protein